MTLPRETMDTKAPEIQNSTTNQAISPHDHTTTTETDETKILTLVITDQTRTTAEAVTGVGVIITEIGTIKEEREKGKVVIETEIIEVVTKTMGVVITVAVLPTKVLAKIKGLTDDSRIYLHD